MRTALPDPWGGVLVIGIFLSIWANDSFAYLVGSKIGKHKMAPRVSPISEATIKAVSMSLRIGFMPNTFL